MMAAMQVLRAVILVPKSQEENYCSAAVLLLCAAQACCTAVGLLAWQCSSGVSPC